MIPGQDGGSGTSAREKKGNCQCASGGVFYCSIIKKSVNLELC